MSDAVEWFTGIAKAISLAAPSSLDVYEILAIAQAVVNHLDETVKPDFSTHEGRVAYAKADPAIQAEVAAARKIVAIKLMRQAAQDAGVSCGLREAKNAVEAAYPNSFYIQAPGYCGRCFAYHRTGAHSVCVHGLSQELCDNEDTHYPPDVPDYNEPPF